MITIGCVISDVVKASQWEQLLWWIPVDVSGVFGVDILHSPLCLVLPVVELVVLSQGRQSPLAREVIAILATDGSVPCLSMSWFLSSCLPFLVPTFLPHVSHPVLSPFSAFPLSPPAHPVFPPICPVILSLAPCLVSCLFSC